MSEKYRILFVTPAYPPFPGGGERYVRSLAQELVRAGHRLTVVSSSARTERDLWQKPQRAAGQAVADKDGPISVIRCPLKGMPGGRPGLLAWRKSMVLLSALPGDQSRLLNRMARLVPAMADLKETLFGLAAEFDLIHAFNVSWEYPLVAAWQLAGQRRRPLIVTPFAHLGVGHGDRVARNSTMDHQRRIMNDAAAVLTLTSVEQAGLARWGVREEHIDTIGGGLDPLPPAPAGDPLQYRPQIPAEFALFLGRVSYDKGAVHAVQAINRLNQSGVPLNLVLAGQPAPEFERFYNRLDQSQKKAVHPLGLVSEAEKQALLKQASMLLLPSRTDSFGIVLLEAWAYGKPVIGARGGGIPGVIDDEKNGLLVSFGAVEQLAGAIQSLLENPELSRKMGRHGQEKVKQHYSWPQVCARVLANYRRALTPGEQE